MNDLTEPEKLYLARLLQADLDCLRDVLETCQPTDFARYQQEAKQARIILAKVMK